MRVSAFYFIVQDMSTPTTSNNGSRPRRAPTPKMSERKKKLFSDNGGGGGETSLSKTVINEEEDSDLGPMSPLQFSASPTNFKRIMGSSASGEIQGKRERKTGMAYEIVINIRNSFFLCRNV